MTHTFSDIRHRFNEDTFEVKAWMSDYIRWFNMDVITYTCANIDGDLANLCW